MSFVIIIPARYNSIRLPGKPLIDINGKPLILHVLDRARESKADRIIVATDHEKIASVVKSAGGEVCITNSNHQSGTERLAEVVEKYDFNFNTVIVNIQSDEPMIPVEIIHQVVNGLLYHQAEMATIAVPLYHTEELFDSNIVKVVIDVNGYALYFSHSTIPCNISLLSGKKNNIVSTLLRHIGIYSYRVGFIRKYIKWKPSPLEQIEMLEQLRVLWYGEKIHVTVMHKSSGISINTKDDLVRIHKHNIPI